MDFSKFSDENFEVKEWVNSALRIRDDRTPVDAHASTLVMKLQLFIQEVNNALEETSQQAVANIPRVMREVENIRHEAAVLKDQMQLVKEDIKKVEENTSQSMKMLMELDTVKSRMQAASSALQEADNWTTLSSDVDKVFESGDVKAIAAKLVGMQRSLSVLQDVPDFAERRRLLEGLKNKLEALLSPRIVAAFNNHSLEDTKDYVRIFTDIDRLDQLQNYYVRCHKTKLQRTWTDVRTDDPNRTMLDWLSTFYDVILSTWHTEITWCSQVFPEPGTVLCVLLTQTLTHLDPSLVSCIAEYIKDEPHCLQRLIELRQVTLRFAQGLEKALLQHTERCSSSSISLLVDSVFSPYTQYMLDYPVLQQTYLIDELQTLQLKVNGFLETSGYITESVEKVFHLAEEAIKCCVEFTDSCGVCSLAYVLEEYFSAYAGKLDECISGLRKLYKLDAKAEPETAEEAHEDWTLFQNAIRLIQVCGELLLRTSELDQLLYLTVMDFGQELGAAESPVGNEPPTTSTRPFSWYNYLQKERSSEYRTLIEFVQKLQSGGPDSVVLVSVREQMQALNERAHMLAFDIIFIQIKQQFAHMPRLQVWSAKSPASGAAISDELPTFSLSPQGYITHIGDYLLTLPQQLEPFVTQENPSLDTALRTGRLPFPDAEPQEEENHPASAWLGSVARGAMHTYVENIQRIHQLTPYSTKQLITDIEYFCNVLGALEVEPSETMTHIESLLKTSPEEFHEVAAECNVEDRIRIAIGAIRNIH